MEKTIKILICDESSDERKKIADCLIKNGKRNPDEADNGECAVRMARSVKYDIVIVDLSGKVIEGELNPSSDTPTQARRRTYTQRFPPAAKTPWQTK